ncbi:MAG TPA: AtpZ/AtpI family protein [Pirellulales bacterium]|nr:AtpZ/AtpI family protein [Pirellulales bacterium]
MNDPDGGDEPFLREIERQARRAGRARGTRLWQGIVVVGAVGWMVAVPAVLGALGGHWLDRRFGTGIFWTLPLLMLGTILGCVSAWRHVRKELDE